MVKKLDVYLKDTFVGNLIQDDHGQMVFDYAESWLNSFNAAPLSHSLPLRKERFTSKECKGFFAGILPEEGKREVIARNLGISPKNDFSMLESIGGECAGAVTFLPEGEKLPTSFYYQEIKSHELATILRDLPRRPLMAGNKDIRLSLAGVQDKIAVYIGENKILIPHGIAPSTHILKPAIEHFEGIVFNEALCMKLANAIGLSSAKVEIGHVEDIDYLLVERYDRTKMPLLSRSTTNFNLDENATYLERLHQEDFCQALGIIPEKKYQSEEGPSLKQCFDLLREVSSAPVVDLQNMLDTVIFNFLVGNHDAHGKNFSLLYESRGLLQIEYNRLAPLYDILSTSYYPDLSKKMAMKIGGEYSSEKILPKHFEKMAEEIGLAKSLVQQRIPKLAEIILSKISEVGASIDHPVAKAVSALIQNNCRRVLVKFKN